MMSRGNGAYSTVVQPDLRWGNRKASQVKAIYSATGIAHYVVDKCNGIGRPVTNLHLQKMLYFLQVIFYDQWGIPLFDDEFEAWPYGPVLPSVYREFSEYGGTPIKRSFDKPVKFLMPEHQWFLDAGIEKLRDMSPWDLVKVSHTEGSPWDYVFNKMGRYKGRISNDLLFASNSDE